MIGVYLKPAVLGALEGKGEGRKSLFGAEPDEAALANVDVRLEHIRVPAALHAVDAVGRDDQIRIGELRLGIDLVLKELLDAERGGSLLKDVQQPLARDAAEAVTAAADRLTAEVHIDVVPMIEAADDGVVRIAVRIAKSRHRLVGKHHAPAEGVVWPIALVDLDFGVGQRFFEENRGIKARGAAAETDDAFHDMCPHRATSMR